MRISELGEFALIEHLKNLLDSEEIGDDCAHIKFGGSFLLLTTDILLEGVHFLSRYPPVAVGWKALSVNVSDIAGNGGRPRWALVSLILPDIEVSYIEDLYKGIREASEFYGCRIVGGNLARGERIGIDVFVVGESRKPVGRGGAEPGDDLCVTGTLGDSRAGLELLLMNKKTYEDFEKKLIEKHLKPVARTDFSDLISEEATAAMDISDGLVADAFHLARRSGVRVEIETSELPLSEELIRFCEKYGRDPLEYALYGGEDYQILFTTKKCPAPSGARRIGAVAKGEGVWIDGREEEPKGFRHF